MKYIFLFFFVVGWLLLSDSKSYAQTDTLTIELKNIPVKRCSTSYDYFQPSHGGCDSTRLFSFKQSFYLDSIATNRGGDTIMFFHNTSFSKYKFAREELLISYNIAESIFRTLTFVADTVHYDSFYSLSSDDASGIAFSVDSVPVLRNGRVLSASFRGSKILQHNFFFQDYFEYWSDFHTGFPHAYQGTFDSSVAPINDSSIISINLSTTSLLGVNPAPILSEENLIIYPTPASNAISFNLNSNEKFIEFYDLLGRELHVPLINKTESLWNVDVSFLHPGIYYLRAGNQMQKFVIQR